MDKNAAKIATKFLLIVVGISLVVGAILIATMWLAVNVSPYFLFWPIPAVFALVWYIVYRTYRVKP
jgi:lipopolysaccharide export LptBFGC system permease protein LptF